MRRESILHAGAGDDRPRPQAGPGYGIVSRSRAHAGSPTGRARARSSRSRYRSPLQVAIGIENHAGPGQLPRSRNRHARKAEKYGPRQPIADRPRVIPEDGAVKGSLHRAAQQRCGLPDGILKSGDVGGSGVAVGHFHVAVVIQNRIKLRQCSVRPPEPRPIQRSHGRGLGRRGNPPLFDRRAVTLPLLAAVGGHVELPGGKAGNAARGRPAASGRGAAVGGDRRARMA